MFQSSYEMILSTNVEATKMNLKHNNLENTNAFKTVQDVNICRFNERTHPLVVKILKIFFGGPELGQENQLNPVKKLEELEKLKLYCDDYRHLSNGSNKHSALIDVAIVECAIKASPLFKNPNSRFFQGSRLKNCISCLLYTSPSPRDATLSRMPSSA